MSQKSTPPLPSWTRLYIPLQSLQYRGSELCLSKGIRHHVLRRLYEFRTAHSHLKCPWLGTKACKKKHGFNGILISRRINWERQRRRRLFIEVSSSCTGGAFLTCRFTTTSRLQVWSCMASVTTEFRSAQSFIPSWNNRADKICATGILTSFVTVAVALWCRRNVN